MAASLIEAMSSGLPPLVTAVSGSVDVVEDGVNGRLIEGDARHIADALALYIEDGATAKSHGDAARAAVLRSYSTDVVIAEYEGLFRRVAAGKPARG
jgi:glycosyltransferase involved in cell wall biosynthesis